jgi:hypothetical protein
VCVAGRMSQKGDGHGGGGDHHPRVSLLYNIH